MASRILDDSRNFWRGSVTLPSGTPTWVLAKNAAVNGVALTAWWYEVEQAEVRAAIRFEKRKGRR